MIEYCNLLASANTADTARYSEVEKLAEKYRDVFRTHPHATPATPTCPYWDISKPPNQPGSFCRANAAAICNATLDKIIPALGGAIQTDVSDNDYVMIEDLESTIESLRTTSTPQQQEKPITKFSSEDLLLLSHDEWKRREERKHQHDMTLWEAGFINGFLTDEKWARDMVDKIRSNQQERKE